MTPKETAEYIQKLSYEKKLKLYTTFVSPEQERERSTIDGYNSITA